MPRGEPRRTCVGCRTERDKPDLRRVVRTSAGEIRLDEGGRTPGRGAYLCPSTDCLDRAIRSRALERTLKAQVPPEVILALRESLGGG